MLIRSQDKTQLVNLDRVGNIKADENLILAVFTNEKNDYVILGGYSTTEKAIKVLDMIQMHYACTTVYLNNGTKETQGLLNDVPKGQDRWCLFKMPQDHEVLV